MPNEHGQITEDDFAAPEGQFRIMQESMTDGELEIVADYRKESRAKSAMRTLVEEDQSYVFTLCDDRGNTIDHM
jgi:hypothetical protein